MCLPIVCFGLSLDFDEMVIVDLVYVLDPKSDSCNSECGALTASNVARHIACRLQCVLPDFTGLFENDGNGTFNLSFDLAGTRLALKCGSGSTYFSLIHECVPLSIAALPSFVSSFSNSIPCNGTTVGTNKDLEGLRYCDTVNGELDIVLKDLTADYSALYDIDIITGLSLLG